MNRYLKKTKIHKINIYDTEFVKCRIGFVSKFANILKDSWLITAVQETELKASSC